MRKLMAASAWLPAFVLMHALAPVALAAPVTHTVVIDGMAYSPAVTKVKQGDRITWVNKDFFAHRDRRRSQVRFGRDRDRKDMDVHGQRSGQAGLRLHS